jgi:hypothetical protein
LEAIFGVMVAPGVKETGDREVRETRGSAGASPSRGVYSLLVSRVQIS